MSAYLLAQIQVHDWDTYKQYTARTPAIIAKHGGRFLVRGGETEVLEGEGAGRRVVVLEFPSMVAARAFYQSPEYQEVKRIRTSGSDAQFLIVQGC
ncbi:MAG: DUF1330 domain-containing protein [Steroidobacteraceae bacterium]